MTAASSFLSKKEKQEIALTIHEAEQHSRGEIRVFIEKKCKQDVMERALKIFHQLNMHHTKERNGVLIYVAYIDHVFAILGDKGIHEKVPENFWDDVKELLAKNFAEGKFTEGLKQAILQCGEHLKKHFPAKRNDTNELSDEVVFGDE
jgi:uncharacterized membrane protein